MNELKLKDAKIIPAKVDFDKAAIESQLNEVLVKYSNLVFTEETVKDCKSTLQDLNKAKKALDTFRKDTKKKLTEDVSTFETDIKSLISQIDGVHDPIKKQYEDFEDARKIERELKVKTRIAELASLYELNQKYASLLVVDNKFLNKSTTWKSIELELTTTVERLKFSQSEEESSIAMVKEMVRTTNESFNVTLVDSIYLQAINNKPVQEIVMSITQDAQKAVSIREAQIKREEELKAAKVAKEIKAKEDAEIAEKQRIERESKESVKVEPTIVEDVVPFELTIDEIVPIVAIEDVVSSKVFSEIYKVQATESQLDMIEAFFTLNEIKWEVVD